MREGKKPGLWDNIHAKRKRIKAGSGERMRKPGSEGAPTAQDFKDASEDIKELSNKTLQSYMSKASDARGHRKLSTKKVDNRYKGVATASKKLAAESTDAYGKSMERIADKKKKDAITTSDKDKLKKLSDMMKRANEETKPIKLRGFGPKGEKGNMGSSVARSHLMKKDTLIANPKTQKVSKVTSSRAKSAVKKGFVYAEDTNEGAMSRLDVQRQERERLGKDKVKGSGLKTYKKKTSEPSRSLSRIENVEEAKFGSEHGYKISHEKSVRGGYRAKLVNPQGKVSYLGGTSYKKPSHAKGEAQAYHDKYFNSTGMKNNDRGAERAVHDYRQKNKQHVHEGTTMLSFMEVAGQRGRPKKGEGSESDKHIIMQLRSVQDLHRMGGDKHVQFSGGQKAKVKPHHVNAILQAHDKLNPDGKRRLRVAIGRHPQGLHKVATALTKKR